MTAPAYTPTRAQHLLGVALALLVAVLWVLSAEVVQLVLVGAGADYSKPYFVTYYSLSAFIVCLLGFLRPSWRAALYAPPAAATRDRRLGGGDYTPLAVGQRAAATAPTTTAMRVGEEEAEVGTDADGEGGEANGAWGTVVGSVYNARQVWQIALGIAPLFFLADWVFTLGISMTSVSSSSSISTLTVLFTLGLSSYAGLEAFTVVKLAAALASIAGVAVISWYDSRDVGESKLAGNVVSLISAFLYALYTTMLKKQTGRPGTLDVSMLFGFIGAITVVGGVPGLVVLHVAGWERFELPSLRVAAMLLGNALVGTVLSDFLWAKSIVYTSATIGTLALSVTVPLSIVIDYFVRGLPFRFEYLLGCMLVLVGFVVINVEELRKEAKLSGSPEEAGVSELET